MKHNQIQYARNDSGKPTMPLRMVELPLPECGADEVWLKVRTCGVCRTDPHILDSALSRPRLPLIPGQEIVGVVLAKGARVEHVSIGQRPRVPWLGHTCGECRYCTSGHENLCDIVTDCQLQEAYHHE
jgi:propanol-preferring alcohol dehydrogenase